MSDFRFVQRDDGGFEQIVMAEVLIPNVPNSYGDIYTEAAIREFCYTYAIQGYGIDVYHEQEDIIGTGAVVVESFIARAGDPDFHPGSWVVAMKILDDDLWQEILDGKINGYSYEALTFLTPVVYQNLRERQISGITEPDPHDGHTHSYLVVLDATNRPVAGGTSLTNGHSHTISRHTTTDSANGHTHRYQVLVATE